MITAELTLFDTRLTVTSSSPAALDYAATHLPRWACEPVRVDDVTLEATLRVVDVPSQEMIAAWREGIEEGLREVYP